MNPLPGYFRRPIRGELRLHLSKWRLKLRAPLTTAQLKIDRALEDSIAEYETGHSTDTLETWKRIFSKEDHPSTDQKLPRCNKMEEKLCNFLCAIFYINDMGPCSAIVLC